MIDLLRVNLSPAVCGCFNGFTEVRPVEKSREPGYALTFTYTMQGKAGMLTGRLVVVPGPSTIAMLLAGP